jgi:hypothetical protein
MKHIIKKTSLNVFLMITLLVLLKGQLLEAAPPKDTTFVVTAAGKGHGFEAIEGFELVHPVPELVPFGEGEYLLFSIQYGLIYAGDATLEVRSDALVGGREAYHAVSVARTNRTFDVIYKVRDRHESFMDKEYLYSLRFEKHLREGKFRRDKEVVFDQLKHLAVYQNGDSVGIPPNTQDFLSALYYVRTLPIEPGQAVWMANHSDGKNYPIFVKVLRRERIEVTAGVFDCLVIEPVLETSALFENTGKLTIWLTDDNLRMPVLMRSKVMVGAFEAVLKEYRLSGVTPREPEVEGASP